MNALKKLDDFRSLNEYEDYLMYTIVTGTLVKNGQDVGTVLAKEGKIAEVENCCKIVSLDS